MMKKIYRYIQLFWHSLFFGMKGVDSVLTTNHKSQNGFSVEAPDDSGGGVFKDILEQKVTQEVEELRYASYKVAKESKKYRYIGNGKVVKKTETQLSEKHGSIDESDNLPLILIQDNSLICESVLTSLSEVNKKENKKIFHDYNIKIKRDILPRFRIENYVKKLVLKQSDGNYVIDLYCSKYPGQFSERKDRPFLSELERVKNGVVRNSDIFDFNEISFVTSNAWGVDDWFRFSFIDFELYDIFEYDGNYIIRLGCQSNVFMENLLDKVYSESAEKKYEIKEAKENVVIDFNVYTNTDNYKIQDDINLDNLENIVFSIENDK
jgi:hypothetical protein